MPTKVWLSSFSAHIIVNGKILSEEQRRNRVIKNDVISRDGYCDQKQQGKSQSYGSKANKPLSEWIVIHHKLLFSAKTE